MDSRLEIFLKFYGIKYVKSKDIYRNDMFTINDEIIVKEVLGQPHLYDINLNEIQNTHYRIIDYILEYYNISRYNCIVERNTGKFPSHVSVNDIDIFVVNKQHHYYEYERLINKLKTEGFISVYDITDSYYDEEYEDPDADTFKKMYEDTKKGWTSIESFRTGIIPVAWNCGIARCVWFDDPIDIPSKYSSWKDIAIEYRDHELDNIEAQKDGCINRYNDILKEL